MYRKITASLAAMALASGLAAFAQGNATSQPPQPPSPQGQGMMGGQGMQGQGMMGGQGGASGQGMMGAGNMMPMMSAMTRMMDTCNRTMESANHAPAGGSGTATPGTAH